MNGPTLLITTENPILNSNRDERKSRRENRNRNIFVCLLVFDDALLRVILFRISNQRINRRVPIICCRPANRNARLRSPANFREDAPKISAERFCPRSIATRSRTGHSERIDYVGRWPRVSYVNVPVDRRTDH